MQTMIQSKDVERDALFAYHRASETFLHRVMSLFVSSHYKNSPNDLQMLSDAPGHALFVLLAPTDANSSRLPDVLVAIQVALEGSIGVESAKSGLSKGHRASGDLIPWTVSQQYQDPEFASLAGARIVRIATHPELTKMGYGTRAVQLLKQYYSGANVNLASTNGVLQNGDMENGASEQSLSGKREDKSGLLNEVVGPRTKVPPLLRRLSERPPEVLDYIGTSFGLTHPLYNFWTRSDFHPLYIRLTANDLTGEHSCIMISALGDDSNRTWLSDFNTDFRRRFVNLLGYSFRKFTPALALSIAHTKMRKAGRSKTIDELKNLFTQYDLRRLDSYARKLVDHHVIVDMLPAVARTYFLDGFDVSLSPAQAAILISLGLQHCTIDDLEKSLGLQSSQILALFNKVMRKFNNYLQQKEVHALTDGSKNVPTSKAVPAAPEKSNEGADMDTIDDATKELGKENGEVGKEAVEVEKGDAVGMEVEDGATNNKASSKDKPKGNRAMEQYKIIGDSNLLDKELAMNSTDKPQGVVSIKKVIKKQKSARKSKSKSRKRKKGIN